MSSQKRFSQIADVQHFEQNPYGEIGTGILINLHTISNLRKTDFPHSFTTTGQMAKSMSEFNIKGGWATGWNFYLNAKNGGTMFTPARGIREFLNGSIRSVNTEGEFMCAIWNNLNAPRCPSIGNAGGNAIAWPQHGNSTTYGFVFRAVHD